MADNEVNPSILSDISLWYQDPEVSKLFTHYLETLGIHRTQTWGLSLSYSRVISNFRVGIRDNSPPGCYGHILSSF